MPENLRDTLVFLSDLRGNNNKQWFDQNRKRYEVAKDRFEVFVTDLISDFGAVEDLGSLSAKDCIYRINRDIRFSRDKTPYKPNMGAVIGRGGRKTIGRSYYVHIEPDGHSLIASGLYMPSSEELDKMRRSIANDSAKFKRIIQKAVFKRYFGGLEGEKLKTAPQGYPKDHPDIELLRFKQYLVSHSLSDQEVLSPDLTTSLVEMFKVMKPFLTYIQMALEA